MQAFKQNDPLEKKVIDIFINLFNQQFSNRTDFLEGAYEDYNLGGVLYDLNRAPLANAISRGVFRTGYYAIFQLFTRPGTFDFYLDVFKAIFGDDVEVNFQIVAPGHLSISVESLNKSNELLMAREIVSGAYQYHEIMDHEGDNIVVQVTKGIRTQSEFDAIMNEIKPHGIYVDATLIIM